MTIDKLVLLLTLLACSYENASAQKEKSDTIFLLRENKEFYHVVFIENNKNSSFYNAI